MDQPVYKAKVVFLGVNKKDKSYSKYRQFGANGNKYLVEDGAINFLPLEALHALKDSYELITKMSATQEKFGLNLDDPSDAYEKVKDFHYDITVIAEYSIGKNGKDLVLIPKDAPETEETKKAKDEAKIALRQQLEKEIREELEEEYKAKEAALLAELEAIPEADTEKEIEDLINEDAE